MADKNKKAPFYLIDTQSQFYRPLGMRLGICVAVVLWATLETWHKDPFWSVISIACAVYCVYVLFWTYKPPEEPAPRPPDPEEDDEPTDHDAKRPTRIAPANDDNPKI